MGSTQAEPDWGGQHCVSLAINQAGPSPAALSVMLQLLELDRVKSVQSGIFVHI